ncbi:OmpA family protein [Kordiimonas aestuarii]|uniref:OmpA family protein n=1 Tax=Kordiimonas aestuarii TaxID=1005925 RepID=UPI0021D2EE43|nr:OmpA family protein [Kordiimonas aestuarii]
MRKILLPILLGTASTVAIADDHLYGGFEAGLTSSSDTEINRTVTGLDLEDDKKMGGMLGLYFGKAMGRWRVEGEMAVRKNSIDGIDVDNGGGIGLPLGERPAAGNQKSTSLMANAWYQLAGNEDWKLFAGLGLGVANIDVNNFRNGPNRTIIHDSGWTTAGQGMVQLIREFDGGMELGLGARHFRTFDNTMNSEDGNVGYAVRNNEVFVRLGWKFGGDEPKRVEPTPAPVARPTPKPEPVVTPQVKEEPKPEPKPAPLPGPFMVFFDFDKSDITPDAARIIREAAKAFKDQKTVRLMATGHTDTAGTQEYNMRLAKRRAEAVKAALIAEGVDAGNIMTDAKGESDLLVSTGDGVREPQNRRSEIVLKRR